MALRRLAWNSPLLDIVRNVASSLELTGENAWQVISPARAVRKANPPCRPQHFSDARPCGRRRNDEFAHCSAHPPDGSCGLGSCRFRGVVGLALVWRGVTASAGRGRDILEGGGPFYFGAWAASVALAVLSLENGSMDIT